MIGKSNQLWQECERGSQLEFSTPLTTLVTKRFPIIGVFFISYKDKIWLQTNNRKMTCVPVMCIAYDSLKMIVYNHLGYNQICSQTLSVL